MDISSYYQTLTSFDRQELLKMCRFSLVDALPAVPAVRSLFELIFEIDPQLARNDDLADPEGQDFILTSSKERTAEVIDLYLKRRVEIAAPSEELKSSAQTNLKSAMVDACHQRMLQIEKIAADFGIKKVVFAVSISPDLPSPGSEEVPYEAVGSRFSPLNAPMIVCTPPQLKIKIDSSIAAPTEDSLAQQRKLNEKAKDFIVAHEMVHIAKNHALIAKISYAAFSLLATGVWAAAFSRGLSLASIARAYGMAFGAAVPFELFFYTLRRSQEKEADLEAMKYLRSNEGAIAAHEGFVKGGVIQDLEHPPLQERFAYIQAQKIADANIA